MTEHLFKITGLRCANCANTARKALEQIRDVSAEVNFATEEAIVRAPDHVGLRRSSKPSKRRATVLRKFVMTLMLPPLKPIRSVVPASG